MSRSTRSRAEVRRCFAAHAAWLLGSLALLATPAVSAAERQLQRGVVKPAVTHSAPSVAQLQQRITDLETAVEQLSAMIRQDGNSVVITSSDGVRIEAGQRVSVVAGEDVRLSSGRDVRLGSGKDVRLQASRKITGIAATDATLSAGAVAQLSGAQVRGNGERLVSSKTVMQDRFCLHESY